MTGGMRLTVCSAALLCLLVLVTAPAAGSAGLKATSFNAGIVWADDGIFEANVDGSGVRRLVPSVADQHYDPAWSPSGDALVFSGRNSDSVTVRVLRPPRETPGALVLKGRWTSPSRRNFSYLLEPAWAPDERHIAFSDFLNPLESTIRIASMDTRRLRSLTKPRALQSDSSPAWSPRGRTIAFVRRLGRTPPRIMLVGRDGSGMYTLTRGESPSWSPDGLYLVYARGTSIFRIRVASRARTRLASNLRNAVDLASLQPRWSPDGRKILYVTSGGIWTMDADGSDRVLVVRRSAGRPYPWVFGGVGWRPG